MQIKVDRTGTDPTTATITTRDCVGGLEDVHQVEDEANAIAMTDALENVPDPTEENPAQTKSVLGVWRGVSN